MVIEAGPLLPYILWEPPGTGTELPQLMDQVDGILHRPGAGIGAEIPALILLHGPGKQDPGEGLVHGHLNIRIRFVIL